MPARTAPRSPSTRRTRRAGRPADATGDARSALLDAAIGCFTRDGIAGTSISGVARAAGVTPAMVHYYFGDKDALVKAVIEERLLPAFATMREGLSALGDAPLPRVLEGFVDGVTEMVQAHPWLPPLWVREVLCEGGALRAVLAESIGPQIPRVLAQRFARDAGEGALAPGIDPRLLVVTLVGLTLFPAAGAPVWRTLLGAEAIAPLAMRAHTLAVLQGVLAVRADAGEGMQ